MSEDEKKLQLKRAEAGTGNTVSVSAAYLLKNRQALERGGVPFYRVVRLPDSRLGVERARWSQLEDLPTDLLDKRQFVVPKDWESRLGPDPVGASQADAMEGLVRAFSSLSPEDRVREVTEIRHTLEDLKKNNAPPEKKAEAIMEAVKKTFVINKASLRLNRSEIGSHQRTIATETTAVVTSVVSMVEESETTVQLFEAFSSLSNGQTINHISRVFTSMTGFMHYYNRIHQERIAQGVRLVFEREFAEIYRHIMGPIPNHLFVPDNLVQLPMITPPEMKRYALGAFLHDLGKMANLDYFESDLAFDASQIQQHVFVSVQLILMNYGTDHTDARLMAGDHHNALFQPGGYGVSRMEREKIQEYRSLPDFERCTAGTADDFIAGRARGFLATEMLAVCDVYDAMTDASRTYKKAMNPAEAVQFMADRPVGSGKLDPVIFSLFVDFLLSSGIEVDAGHGLQQKVKRRKAA